MAAKFPRMGRTVARFTLAATVVAAPLLTTSVGGAHASAVSCSSSTPVSSRPSLKVGDTGSCVTYLQTLLRNAKFITASPDGSYGPITAGAVQAVSEAYRVLRRDGTTTTATWAVLEKINKPFDKYTCGNGSSNKVLLVFDDQPVSTTSYRALIDAARAGRYGIGIAPNGEHVKSGLVDVKAARDRGLLVVDHTYHHYPLTTLSSEQVVWEITRSYVGSNYVRPPYGDENSRIRAILAQYGKNDCLWNVDPQDWKRVGRPLPLEVPDHRITPSQVADYIVGHAWGGSTVVVHMNHLGTDARQLARIDEGLRARGLMLCRNWGRASNPSMPNQYCL